MKLYKGVNYQYFSELRCEERIMWRDNKTTDYNEILKFMQVSYACHVYP